MAIAFSEFESTVATVLDDIKAAILASSDWSEVVITPFSTTTSGSATSSGSTVTVASAAGLSVGQSITIASGTANARVRVITAISGNTITVNSNWGATISSGASIITRDSIVQTTTTRGVPIILNLMGDVWDTNVMGTAFYQSWSGTAPGGFTDRQSSALYWRAASGLSAATQLHVTVSAGKEHIFIGIEGPRAHEAGATSTTYGSFKNYIFASDVVPYHAADTTPAIVVGGNLLNTSAGSSVATNSHQVAISRDSKNLYPWTSGRLATLTFPTIYSTDVIAVNRQCSIDNQVYVFPYVLFSESEGMRGRLSRFFFANTNVPSPPTDYPDPVGTRVTFDGIVYKLLAVNKGDGSSSTYCWGQFGSIAQGSSAMRSVIVAVPFAEAT